MNSIDIKEKMREAKRNAEREHERMHVQMEAHNEYMIILDEFESMIEENERLKSELEQQRAENEELHQQLDDKEMKLNELGKFSVGVAKKSSQEGLEKAFRVYINTSKRKTQAKREVAKTQLLDFITTAKLEMPDDIMDALNQLDDEVVAEPTQVTTTVNVQPGGINVQQANNVSK
jgi:hypothetical protein